MFTRSRARKVQDASYTGVGRNLNGQKEPDNDALAAAFSIGKGLNVTTNNTRAFSISRSPSIQNGFVERPSRADSLLKRSSISRSVSLNKMGPNWSEQLATPPNSLRRNSINGRRDSSRLNSMDMDGYGSHLNQIAEDSISYHTNQKRMQDLKVNRHSMVSPSGSRLSDNGGVNHSGSFGHGTKMVKKYIPTPTGIKVIEVPQQTYEKELERTNSMRGKRSMSRSNSMNSGMNHIISRSSSLIGTASRGKRNVSPRVSSLMGSPMLGTMAEKEENENRESPLEDDLKALELKIEHEKKLSRELAQKKLEFERYKNQRIKKEKELELLQRIPNNPSASKLDMQEKEGEDDEEVDVPITKTPIAVDEVDKKHLAEKMRTGRPTHDDSDNDSNSKYSSNSNEKVTISVQEPANGTSEPPIIQENLSAQDIVSNSNENSENSEAASSGGSSSGTEFGSSIKHFATSKLGNNDNAKEHDNDLSGSESAATLNVKATSDDKLAQIEDSIREDVNENHSVRRESESVLIESSENNKEGQASLNDYVGVEEIPQDNETGRSSLAKHLRPTFDAVPEIIKDDTLEVPKANSINLSSNSSVYSSGSMESLLPTRRLKKPIKSAMKNSSSKYNLSATNSGGSNPALQAYLSLTTAENTRLNSKLSSSKLTNNANQTVYNGTDNTSSHDNQTRRSIRKSQVPAQGFQSRSLRPQSSTFDGGHASESPHMAARTLRDNRSSYYVAPIGPHPTKQPNYQSPSKVRAAELYRKANTAPASTFPSKPTKEPRSRTTLRDMLNDETSHDEHKRMNTFYNAERRHMNSRIADSDDESGAQPVHPHHHHHLGLGRGLISRFKDSDDDLPLVHNSNENAIHYVKPKMTTSLREEKSVDVTPPRKPKFKKLAKLKKIFGKN